MEKRMVGLDDYHPDQWKREAYYSLANELTGGYPFDENDWDPDYLARARAYAMDKDLPFPPPPMASGMQMTISQWGMDERGSDDNA